jgi:cytochrome c-type biogenesis protein CcmF
MAIELGHFALILAFCLALTQAFFGLAGAQLRRPHWMAVTSRAVAGQLVMTLCAFAALIYSFVHNDFSVLYVARNSNSALPTYYRVAAVWGAHEGSLVLWMLAIALWTTGVAAFSRQVPQAMLSRVLGVLGLINAGFALFILWTSSPFERMWPAAVDGADLNPLLQDPGLTVHPPMLYIGYVGFSVPFAFAIAAMLEGKLESSWARFGRPWAVLPWLFLTLGIMLGSWWAFYELGWGGWWFWDSVENASFMPWLLGTALIHSLAATEKRGLFKSWTLLLAIGTFSLSVLGTFLVRSGIIESVHAFAADPSRGAYLLVFLAFLVGWALVLYAWRAPQFRSDAGFEVISRESFLLINNVLLVAATALIFFGTLYPVLLDFLKLGKVSVGPPYFNPMFMVPMLPLALALGIGMHASWKRASFERLKTWLWSAGAAAVVIGVLLATVVYGWESILTTVGFITAAWVGLSALIEPIERWRHGHSLSASTVGMSVAHFGVALFVLGITTAGAYHHEKDLSLSAGESTQIAGYDMQMIGVRTLEGPNYTAVESEVRVTRNGKPVTTLYPQKRTYPVQRTALAEMGIDARLGRYLHVSMGDSLGEGRWSFRVGYKPMLMFVWLGAIVMAGGGLIVLFDRRYRARVPVSAESAAAAGKAAGAQSA